MKLSSILNEIDDLTLEFGAEKLNIRYKPGVYTPKFEQQARTAGQADDADSISSMLSPMLASWDLSDDDGNIVATDIDTLRGLPTRITSTVLMAIIRGSGPNKKTSDSTTAG